MKRGVFLDNHKKYVLWIIDIAKLLAVVCGATLLGIFFVKVGFPETNIVVIYIFAVLLVARFTKGYFYGILSSVVCLLCFNYFFTAPYHTLAVNDPSYMITFCIMLITALITSALTTKEKLMTMEATRKGVESQTLYMLSSRLSDAADIEAVLKIAVESMSRLLQANVGCIYVGEQAEPIYIQQLETEHKEFIADPKLYDGRFVPYDVYTHVLHTADISLLPLHDTEFNRTKSDLKFIESAAHGAVVLASPTVYERTVVDGCTGCIYHSPEEFTAKLERLIEDKRYRHAIAAAGRQYVKEHRLLSQHYLERAQAYQWLISHQKELDRELGERLD